MIKAFGVVTGRCVSAAGVAAGAALEGLESASRSFNARAASKYPGPLYAQMTFVSTEAWAGFALFWAAREIAPGAVDFGGAGLGGSAEAMLAIITRIGQVRLIKFLRHLRPQFMEI